MYKFLVVDIGTEEAKSAIIDDCGKIICEASQNYTLRCPKPGWAEQDPDDWWHATLKVIKEVLKIGKVASKDIAAIGICGQMHAPVPVSKHYELLYRSPPLWCDKRNIVQCIKLKEKIDEKEIIKKTGNTITPAWMGIKIMWIKENCPSVYERTYKFLTPKDFIVMRLTNTFITDWSEASGSFLMDITTGYWSQEFAEILGIDLGKLPEIYPSYEIIGEVTDEAARLTGLNKGTPVIAGGGDFPCAVLGSGIISSKEAVDVAGTSSLFAVYTKEPIFNTRLMNLHHVIDGWISFNEIEAGLLRWFRDNFGVIESKIASEKRTSAYKIMDEEAEKIPPGADALIVFPHFIGERFLNRLYSRGAIIGLTLAHTRQHIIRAIMEGITYELRRISELIEENDGKINLIKFVGGGASSTFWAKLKADIYGKPVATLSSHQSGLMGLTILAMMATKVMNNIQSAVNQLIKISQIYEPNPERHGFYNRIYILYKEIYERLGQLYSMYESLRII
jgi:xylulokinase